MSEKHVSTSMKTLNTDSMAQAIGIPTSEWPGNCHAVAGLIIETGQIDGILTRGHYYGPIHQDSKFFGRPIVPHSWITDFKGMVIDPLRWEFEQVPPYIYTGSYQHNEYDAGGNFARESAAFTPPKADFNDKEVHILQADISTTNYIHKDLLKRPGNGFVFSFGDLMWVANLPLCYLGDSAADIYKALRDSGHGSLIPIDNLNMVESGLFSLIQQEMNRG